MKCNFLGANTRTLQTFSSSLSSPSVFEPGAVRIGQSAESKIKYQKIEMEPTGVIIIYNISVVEVKER